MTSPSHEEKQKLALTRKILWKLDYHILPPLALLWLASFIDRSNFGNARIAGLERDAHLKGNQFNIALSVFYATYLLVEIPSNMVLRKMRANRWIPLLVFLWGVVTTLTSFVKSFGGLLAIRLCLGFCEGGLLPGMILYLSAMYKRQELQFRVGIFYASASLSGAFGGLLATAITKMEGVGGLAGWRWIYILEGLATIIAGLVAALVLPADIESAKFLTDEERQFAATRLRVGDITNFTAQDLWPPASEEKSERDLQYIEPFELQEVIRGLSDIQAWLTGTAYLGVIVSIYSYSLFLPTIVAGLGYSGGAAQLHTVPPYVAAVVLTVIVAYLSDVLRWRGPFILICLPVAMIGYILAITAKSNEIRYLAVFFMAAGIYPTGPSLLSILPNNTAGHYKKATTTALSLAIGNAGGFVATFAYTQDQAPQYHRGHIIVLGFVVLSWCLISANIAYCLWENKLRREGHRDANLEKYQKLWADGKTRAPIGDRHPKFLFTL